MSRIAKNKKPAHAFKNTDAGDQPQAKSVDDNNGQEKKEALQRRPTDATRRNHFSTSFSIF